MIETAPWPDPASPLRIEYSPAAMERIRLRAIEGLKALPRTGTGVGGLLLGHREGAKITIIETADIPCSYAFGPAFILTPHEKAVARELATGSETPAIGWYFTRTRGELALTDSDIELFRDLFPAQWQITLVLHVDNDTPPLAAFFYCNEEGELKKGVERDTTIVEPPTPVLPPPAAAAPESLYRAPFIPDEPEERERPSRWRRYSWVLSALAALVAGAVAFEVQNVWLIESVVPTTQVESAPSSQTP
jgi:hypothetical protein